MIKAVIFDVDGTLCESYPLCLTSFIKSIEHFLGRTPSENEILETFGPEEAGTIRAFIPEHLEKGVNLYTEIYDSLHDEICPNLFDNMKDTLDYLKNNGFSLALITGKAEKSCEITLKKFGISDYFEYKGFGVIDKPVKDIRIMEYLEKFSYKNDEVLYVGDAVGDIVQAKAAGVRTVSALWSKYVKKDEIIKAKPFMTADDPLNLIEIVNSN